MMDIDDIPRGRVFQYATASGFAVETLNPVLPIFNADDKSVDWFDLSVPSLNNLYFSPYLDPLFRNSYLDKSGVTVLAPVATARSCSDEANTNRVDFTSTQWFDPFSLILPSTSELLLKREFSFPADAGSIRIPNH